MLIRIAGITEDSIVDGPGLRLTVFLQGCPHRCPGCHNPETWDCFGGKLIDDDDIVAIMDRNAMLDGLTLSGGEPLLQTADCLRLAKEAKKRGLNVWCYTGYTWEVASTVTNVQALLRFVDVLVDGPFVESQRTLELPWRGSRNQRLIDVQKSLKTGEVIEYIATDWGLPDVL